MLVVENQTHFKTVVEFAKRVGLFADGGDNNNTLANRLKYLETYGGKNDDGSDRMRVRLLPDGAPMSFYFVIEQRTSDGWSHLFSGGLLFHGPHDRHGSGAGPTFAVTLDPASGWSIHT